MHMSSCDVDAWNGDDAVDGAEEVDAQPKQLPFYPIYRRYQPL